MRFGNIYVLLIHLYLRNISSIKLPEMEFFGKRSLLPGQFDWLLDEFSINQDDDRTSMLKEILLGETGASGQDNHPHARFKRDIDEEVYRNFNITKIEKPTQSQLNLGHLDINPCNDQVMSQVFELNGKSIFILGNYLFLVDENLTVTKHKKLFSSDFHFSVRLTEGVIINNELYFLQVISTGNTPNTDAVNCEDFVYSRTYYALFRVKLKNMNEFEIEELSHLDDEDDHKNSGDHVRVALSYIEEENRIVIVAFHHVVGKNLLDYLHFRIGQDDVLMREGHQIQFIDKIHDLKLISTVGSAKEKFIVLAKDETIELHHLVELPQNRLIQEIEIANTRRIEFFGNRWGNYLLAVDNKGLATVFWFDGEQFIEVQSFSTGGTNFVVDSTFVDDKQMVVIGNENGSLEFFQFAVPGVMRQVIPVEDIARPNMAVSSLNLGRTITQQGFKYFVVSLVKSSEGNFSFQTSLVEIGHVVSSQADQSRMGKIFDTNRKNITEIISDIMNLSGPYGLVMSLEVSTEEDNWLLKQAEETADKVIELNETISIADTSIDVVSSSLPNLSQNVTIGILLDTFDGFDNTQFLISDSLSEMENSTSTVNMSENVVYKTAVFKTLQPKTYNVDGIIFESVLDIEDAKARNANIGRINGFNVDDALTKTLKIYGDQNIEIPFNFEVVEVGNTEISNSTNVALQLSLLIDASKENELSKPLTFKNIVLEDDSVLDGAKINNINISDIIKKSDLESSSQENPVEINGDKRFNSVLEMKGILVSEINEKVWSTWYDKVLFKEGQDLQIIQAKIVNLPTVNVIKFANIDMLDDADVTFEVLNDIARTDETFTFKEDVVFNDDVTIKNFVANTVNHFSPESFLVDGIVQTISQKMSVLSLDASKVVNQNLINGINLKQIATIAGQNEYTSKVTFKDITVTELLDVRDGKTLDSVDVSVFRMINAFSRGIIYINETLKINGTNIAQLTFGDFPHEVISEKNVREQFLYKNYDQEFPKLTEFDTLVNVSFKQLTIKKTLDNLKLDEVVHTSSNEIINRTVTFTLPTSFMGNVELTGDNSTIAGVDVPKLFNSTAYDFPNSNTKIRGKKTVSHVESLGNVEVSQSFSHLTKDLETFSHNLVRLNIPNTFTANVSFKSDKLNLPIDWSITDSEASLIASTIETIDVTADDEHQVLINGKNLLKFVENIVRNDDMEAVSSDIEFKELVNGIARIDNFGGLIDGENLVEYLSKRILVTDTVIDRSIIVPNVRFEKDINVLVDGSGYFLGEDLWEYVDKLYLANLSQPITGKKTLTGYLTVDGNLNVFDNLDNDNYAFNANLPLLEKEYLSRSKQQAVYLKYNFGSISGVETLDVPVVDGVNISNFCFINENCNIILDGNSLEFAGNVLINDLEGLVRTGGTVFKNEFSAVSSVFYLEDLDVEDLVWLNNGTISNLYENLVVKSDYDYRRNTRYECPENCQEISGMVTFESYEFEAKELSIEKTSKINDGDPQNEVDLEFLNNDCAWMSKENNFMAHKEFNGHFSASAAKIGQLEDTVFINNANVKQLRSDILVKESEVPSPTFFQIIDGTWFISNGFSAGDLKVGGVIDDVKVEDFVRKNHFESERPIPIVRFVKGFNLSGNLESNGSDIENLFENAILLDEDNEDIQMEMIFTDNLQFLKDLKIDYIDEIPMDKVVRTNMDMPRQTIAGLKTALYSVNVKTNIGHTFLNGLHMDDFNEDALRIDREETITLRNITFKREVKMYEVKIPGKEKVGLEVELLNAMKSFAEKLYNFYDEQVVNPLRHFLDKVAEGEINSFGEVETMERQEAPQKYQVSANTSHVDAIRLNEAEWSFSSKVLELNNSNEVCLSTKSSYVSSVSDQTEINDVNAFIFTLESGLWTVSSTNQIYQDGCMLPKDNQVIVTGLTNSGKTDYLDVETMTEKIFVTDISNITGTPSTFGYIKDVVMWDVGNGLFLMAIACSFPEENIHILLFDQKWSYIQKISPNEFSTVLSFKNMHANIVQATNHEDIQLIISGQGYGEGEDKILFFSWNFTGESFALKQTIPSRHLSSLVLMNTQPTSYIGNLAMMIVVSKIQYSKHDQYSKDEFITELLVYKFNDDTNVYDLDDRSHKIISRGVDIVQIKIKEISGYQILFLAETNQIKMLKFVPNQGFQLLSWAKIKGILDINLYEESLEKNEGGPGTTVMIHVTSRENDQLKTTVLSAFVEGKVLTISKTMPYLPTPRTKTTRIINGAYGPWSAWSQCPKSCGNDVPQFRTRLCDNPAPSVGGRTCKETNREYQSCNQHPCPIDGSWSAWVKWSNCSATCGEMGVKTKTRTCDSPAPSEGGLPCAGKDTLQEVCQDPCCPQDGGWSQWGAFTECDMACGVDGIGNKMRFRECNNPKRKCGGQHCPGSNIEIQPCLKECPERVEWLSWGEWGPCSRSCGGGVQKRFRECSSGDELDCVGSNEEHRVCEEDDCLMLPSVLA